MNVASNCSFLKKHSLSFCEAEDDFWWQGSWQGGNATQRRNGMRAGESCPGLRGREESLRRRSAVCTCPQHWIEAVQSSLLCKIAEKGLKARGQCDQIFLFKSVLYFLEEFIRLRYPSGFTTRSHWFTSKYIQDPFLPCFLNQFRRPKETEWWWPPLLTIMTSKATVIEPTKLWVQWFHHWILNVYHFILFPLSVFFAWKYFCCFSFLPSMFWDLSIIMGVEGKFWVKQKMTISLLFRKQ